MELNDSSKIPNEMLNYLGYKSIEELIKEIFPKEILYKGTFNIPEIPEKYLLSYVKKKLSKDVNFSPERIYLGGGVWPIYLPPIINYITSRSEFLTSYTPYQAEISQGTMQALYEYQSLMAELLDLYVVNSSMYDWASAAAEALRMSFRVKKRGLVLIPDHLPTNREKVIKTYLWGSDIQYDYIRVDNDGNIDLENLETKLKKGVSGVYLEYPNLYGYLYDNLDDAIDLIHKYDSLVILGIDPLTLPVIKPPGELGADIAVGEGQPLGLPMSFGGPLLGIFAVRDDMTLIRNMPGRIMGLTIDSDGEKAFAMILQTREQHIRREKATSNICTNEALSAIASAIYISLLGSDGLLRLSIKLMKNAHKLNKELIKLGFLNKYNLPFIREFSLKLNTPIETEKLVKGLFEKGYLFGAIEKGAHIVSINEYHTEENLMELINLIGDMI